jgi:hypothetical protein
MGTTTDRTDPELGYGVDSTPVPQQKKYLVLTPEERAKGFVRPLRDTYTHETCGGTTTMGKDIAETYARQPDYYGATYCCHCRMHRPVGEHGEFVWTGTSLKVGT